MPRYAAWELLASMSIHLILGGARSGKSTYAEQLAIASDLPVTYIATAQVYDDEFGQRIELHKARRPKHWLTVEAPFNLANTLQMVAKENENDDRLTQRINLYKLIIFNIC